MRGVGAGDVPVSVSEPHFPHTVTMLTGAWLTPGNRVELALNGDGTYPRLWEDLKAATTSITLQVYYANRGRMADTLRELLIERAAAGVRVFVLCDAFGTVSVRGRHLKTLRSSGIERIGRINGILRWHRQHALHPPPAATPCPRLLRCTPCAAAASLAGAGKAGGKLSHRKVYNCLTLEGAMKNGDAQRHLE